MGFEARVVFWYCLPPNPLSTIHCSIRNFFSSIPSSNRRELRLHLNVVSTGAGVFKSRHILLHKYVNRIMITCQWRQIQLIIPSRRGFGGRQYQKTKGIKTESRYQYTSYALSKLSIIFFSTLAVKQNEHNCKRDPIYSEYRWLL